jgi:hypothetical protein
MISKRRKNATLRKKQQTQRKRSHRVRRGNRFQIGGNIPDSYIPLSWFDKKFKLANYFLTPEQIEKRNSELSIFKQNLDTFLSSTSGKYTLDNFNEYVTKAIDKSPEFKTGQYYYSNSTHLRVGITDKHPKVFEHTIWPRIKDYINAGFTPEQLLRAELLDITINDILDVVLPNLYKRNLEVFERQDEEFMTKFYTNKQIWHDKRLQIQQNIITELKKDDVDGLFNATKLKNMGFSALLIKNSGLFSPDEIIKAGFTLKELKSVEFTLEQLKQSNTFSFTDFVHANYNLQQLKNAGFTAADFKNSRINITFIKGVGFALTELTDAGYTLKELFDIGYNRAEFEDANYTLQRLKNDGATARQLIIAGFNDLEQVINLRQILDNINGKPYDNRTQNNTGYHLIDLNEAGYDLIGYEKYNLKHIFESGKYAYGEIKDVIDSYKTYANTKPDIKKNLDEIKGHLTKLKDAIKKDNKTMCTRGFTGTTDLNCVYKADQVKTPTTIGK